MKDQFTEDELPVRFLLGDRKILHAKFEAECESCHYSTFTAYVPDNYIIPKASDWGTCLCAQCLNPQLKLEKLAALTKDTSFLYGCRNYDEIDELVTKVTGTSVTDEEIVHFVEWQKVVSEKSERMAKKGKKPRSKISKKIHECRPFKIFKKKLLIELKVFLFHLDNCSILNLLKLGVEIFPLNIFLYISL